MKYYVNNQSEFSVSASTASELIQKIIEQYPSVKFHLVDSDGILRRHFNIFVNGIHIRDLNGMETALKENDKIVLMASAAGGSGELFRLPKSTGTALTLPEGARASGATSDL
jgi:sulfur-carrier protein